MNGALSGKVRWYIVVVFAVAMAWVESAVVYYLRSMIHRLEPYQPNPLPEVGGFGQVEFIREAATLLMLLAVGVLAGRTWRSRLGFAVIAFGVWDIFYYVFLWAIYGWPHSLLDWDILFLIPLPWWGPVWAPMSIAVLMILWGTLACRSEATPTRGEGSWLEWGLCGVGMALALYTFMADSLQAVGRGVEGLRNMLPSRFNWPVFLAALVLMAVPVFAVWGQSRTQPTACQLIPPDSSD